MQEKHPTTLMALYFRSKASRDDIFEKVANDSKMVALVAPIMSNNNPIFDPKRMVYGLFRPLIQVEKS